MVAQHNFPTAPTSFVGRTQELTKIADLLHNPECRLLTLIGPGGIGKTRLAIEAAARAINQKTPVFDTARFASFQGVTASDQILSTLADALELEFYAGEAPLQQLIGFLYPTTTLLILDNLEHLLEGMGFIPELLAGAPHLKILATSRELLNLQEEWLFPVSGMAFPDGDQDLKHYDAVQLFIQLARRVRPDFSLEDEQASVLRICRLVEGMPLALEMAATWLKRLPAEQIAQEIERGLDILEHTSRNVPAKHRTMRSVFAQSWNLLRADEQDGLLKLSVFRGGFDREAAAAVADLSLGTLSALVEKSWLRLNVDGRYDFHELARQYAEARLEVMADISNRVHELHCDYFTRFLAEREDSIGRFRAKSAIDELGTYLNNVRAAWEWAVDNRDDQAIMTIGTTFGHYFNVRWFPAEGAEIFGKAIVKLQAEEGHALGLAVARYEKGRCAIKLGWFDVELVGFQVRPTASNR